MKTKSFRVAAISDNANSFGLKQHIMVPRTGKAWKVLKSICLPWKVGQDIAVPIDEQGSLHWAIAGVEIPQEIALLPPRKMVKELYK